MGDNSKSPRHRWQSERRIAACDVPDGCNRTERSCDNPNCGLVMITVHPPVGYAYRKWRHRSGGNEFQLGGTPPCGVAAEAREVAFQ